MMKLAIIDDQLLSPNIGRLSVVHIESVSNKKNDIDLDGFCFSILLNCILPIWSCGCDDFLAGSSLY